MAISKTFCNSKSINDNARHDLGLIKGQKKCGGRKLPGPHSTENIR
jgi:hypothetical protein